MDKFEDFLQMILVCRQCYEFLGPISDKENIFIHHCTQQYQPNVQN